MRTVKWLREELAKFPDEALVYAYEGEETGLSVQAADEANTYGFIHCSGTHSLDEPASQLLQSHARRA